MAGRARLSLLAAGVLLAHLLALDWFARALDYGSVLQQRADPMFTRLLRPQPPLQQPPAAPPLPRAARPARQATGMAASLPAPQPAASSPQAATRATAPPEAAQQPQPERVQAPAEPATPQLEQAPEAEAIADPVEPAPAMDRWPADTRLSYRLDGRFREGPLYGDARVQWQREGSSYQVRLDIEITPWVSMVMTSQGEVTEEGLLPRAYEEERRGKRRAAQFGERAIALEGGRSAPRPQGVQDTVSQFVELAHRFATGRETLEVGSTVSFWMARPGAVDRWTYDVAGRELLRTRELGEIEAFHLKPRPIANPRGNVTAEMWFAPSLQYLPVRIRVSMGEEAYVDLLVEKIEQR